MSRPVTSRRAVPYSGAGGQFVVPAEIWDRTLATLRAYGAASSEGLVFWGGCVSGEVSQVTGLYLIGHEPQGGRVRASAGEARWLVQQLRVRDEKLIAQVHSHPGEAFHSAGDDRHAASFHPGYLSIVVPRFGREVRDVCDCAVLEFEGACFVQLSSSDLHRRLRILPLFVEMRRQQDRLAERKTWIATFVSSLRRKLTGLRRP